MTRFGTRSARSAGHLNDKSDYVNHRGDVPIDCDTICNGIAFFRTWT